MVVAVKIMFIGVGSAIDGFACIFRDFKQRRHTFKLANIIDRFQNFGFSQFIIFSVLGFFIIE